MGVFALHIAYRQHTYLLGTHPHRQCARIFFNKVSKCALVAAEARSVENIWQSLVPVLIYIVHTESLGEQHVYLDGDESVLLTVDVTILNVKLRSVESSLSYAYLIVKTDMVENLFHCCLSLVPLLSRTLVLIIRISRVPL